MTNNPLQPTASVLSKLGSIIVHYKEMLSTDGHAFDRTALEALLNDHEVVAWLGAMDAMAMLPKWRKGGQLNDRSTY